MKHTIIIAGAGGIGKAVGLLLANSQELDVRIYMGDLYLEAAQQSCAWIEQGLDRRVDIHAFAMPESGSNDEMDHIFARADIVLDCLPGSQAPRIARMALNHDLHYANLTEYVQETNEIVEMTKDASRGFVLQTGLAPGFINILGNKLFQNFCKQHRVNQVDRLSMKVGALPQHAVAPHFYAFTWSPVGVATEYVKDSIVIRNGQKRSLPALSELDTIIINGVTYESNLTSGGAADLPDSFQQKVTHLDYKTIRYPDHYKWVADQLATIPDGPDRASQLLDLMLQQIPSVEDDVVIVYAQVKGKDHKGVLRAIEKAYRIEPTMVGKRKLRAIQSTTAAPLCEVARMLLEGRWQGPVFQSQIDPEEFMRGRFVQMVYGDVQASSQPVSV